MQIKMIDSLLELYKTKNISKTSERLFMTQQGLSRQIEALEEELGISLFIRKKDGVVPTELCHQLIPCFQSMYESYTQALNLISREQGQRLRIGFTDGISHGLSSQFLMAYQKAFSNVCLEVQEWTASVCHEKLLLGELELSILVEPFDKTNIGYELLCHDNMYAAMHITHPYAISAEPLPFQSLKNQQIITGPPDNVLRRFFDYCCSLTRIQPQILMASSYNTDFVNSMSENFGISTLTSAMAFRITNPEIRIRKLVLPVSGNTYICWENHNKNMAAIKHFVSFSRDYFQQHPLPCYDTVTEKSCKKPTGFLQDK